MTFYSRLSLEERKKIKNLLSDGLGVRAISDKLERAPSTISREIKRTIGEEEVYYPTIADLESKKLQASRRLGKRKIGQELASKIEELLIKEHFSPEQISQHLRKKHPEPHLQISHEAIYQYIYQCEDHEKRKQMIQCLRRRKKIRRRRKRENDKRGIIPNMTPIHERSEAANQRIEVGHWEGDLVVGKGHGSAILTLVERLSRYTIIVPLGTNIGSEAVVGACQEWLGQLPKELQKSLTYDRGKEMTYHERLTEATGIQVYFADPHAPWQRGTNENTNGLIREFFPKGTDFNQRSVEEVKQVEDLLNRRPRKVLGFKTPQQILSTFLPP